MSDTKRKKASGAVQVAHLNPSQIRQGDVLCERIDSLASSLHPRPADRDGSLTLAHGEVTGHRHRFERSAGDEGSALSSLYVHPAAPSDVACVRLGAAQALVHEEHSAHEIPAGVWRISRPYEYAGAELPRRVED